MIIANLLNYFLARRLNTRKSVPIDAIYNAHFAYLDRTRFLAAWTGLSAALEIAPEKLRPDDSIKDFIEKRHLADLYIDRIENYLRDQGIKPGKVDEKASIKELIDILAR